MRSVNHFFSLGQPLSKCIWQDFFMNNNRDWWKDTADAAAQGSLCPANKALPLIQGNHPMHSPEQRTHTGSELSLFSVWKEYEGVAMHFNDLLIRLRTQALGGVAALAALAAVMVRGDLAPRLRWTVLMCAFVLLTLFWVAVWILDMRYYNRLLHGAVKALLELEDLSRRNQPLQGLVLSTRIEQTAEHGITKDAEGMSCFGAARVPLWWFYGSVCLGLLVGLVMSILGMLT